MDQYQKQQIKKKPEKQPKSGFNAEPLKHNLLFEKCIRIPNVHTARRPGVLVDECATHALSMILQSSMYLRAVMARGLSMES